MTAILTRNISFIQTACIKSDSAEKLEETSDETNMGAREIIIN